MSYLIKRASIATGVVDKKFPPENYQFAQDLAADLDLTSKLTAWISAYIPQRQVLLTPSERKAERKRLDLIISLRTSAKDEQEKLLAKSKDPKQKKAIRDRVARLNTQIATFEKAIDRLYTTKKTVDDHASRLQIRTVQRTHGIQYYIAPAGDAAIFRPDAVCIAIKEYINDLLQVNSYSIFEDTTPPKKVTGYYQDVKGVVLPGTIFQSLCRLDLFDCEEIVVLQPKIGTAMGLLAGDKRDIENWRCVTHNRDQDGYFVWAPNGFPYLLYDSEEESGPYTWNQVSSRFERSRIRAGHLGGYRVQADDATGIAASPWTAKLSGTRGSSGGGGAMRSDRIGEVKYCWLAPGVLGKALGLDAACNLFPNDPLYKQSAVIAQRAGAKTASVQRPGEFVYWRAFEDPVPQPPGKKNAPIKSLPLTPLSYSKSDDQSIYQINGLTKKKKGEWQLSVFGPVRMGEPLKHGNRNMRANASTVMAQAFQKLGRGDSGSATEFAVGLITHDAETKKAWPIMSKGLEMRLNEGDRDGWMKKLRTDQEWCHLYGHGDGGNEAIENFLSGSKHCNTEQLAIELAQRFGSKPGLTAKVSGYIFPGTPQPKKALDNEDRGFLGCLNGNFFSLQASDSDLINQAVAYLADNPQPFDKILPDNPQAPMPSLAQFQSYAHDKKLAVQNRVTERLRECVLIPLPLASVIRYKIYLNQVKVFDHFFWAQKESFDLNEFNILYWTVRRIIAEAAGDKEDYDVEIKLRALRNDVVGRVA